MAETHSLFGAWRLVSLRFEFAGTTDRADMFGTDPMGSLILTPDFHMSTVITSRGRGAAASASGQATLFGSMMAYSGRFRLEGHDQFITRVEVAWHPGWVGTDQARTYALDGGRLSIVTAETLHPMFGDRSGRGVLIWVRA